MESSKPGMWKGYHLSVKSKDNGNKGVSFLSKKLYNIQLSSEGEVKVVYKTGIYLEPLTDPEGDSCFGIYQISWIKMKKVTFCNLQVSA